jgi:hypothetical protein
MNKEQQELLDDAYKNFVKSVENNRPVGYVRKVITKSDFIKESNFMKDFREYWGLKIEERTVFEQVDQNNPVLKGSTALYPRKLITVTYKDKTIESYE